jgi:hypothetical protein
MESNPVAGERICSKACRTPDRKWKLAGDEKTSDIGLQ